MSFIYVGRLDEIKGVKLLFDAWGIMAREAPLLVLCGTGPLQEWCIRMASGLNIDVRGYVDSIDVKGLIARSQALILPTLWYEGFPMTIVEAFSVGTPVICSDIGNGGDLTEQGVTGWKFEPGSAEGLVAAVRECMAAGDAIRPEVRRIYNEKYTPAANYRLLSDIYMEVRHANRSFGAEHRKLRR